MVRRDVDAVKRFAVGRLERHAPGAWQQRARRRHRVRGEKQLSLEFEHRFQHSHRSEQHREKQDGRLVFRARMQPRSQG